MRSIFVRVSIFSSATVLSLLLNANWNSRESIVIPSYSGIVFINVIQCCSDTIQLNCLRNRKHGSRNVRYIWYQLYPLSSVRVKKCRYTRVNAAVANVTATNKPRIRNASVRGKLNWLCNCYYFMYLFSLIYSGTVHTLLAQLPTRKYKLFINKRGAWRVGMSIEIDDGFHCKWISMRQKEKQVNVCWWNFVLYDIEMSDSGVIYLAPKKMLR